MFIKFLDFSVEFSSNCTYDYLEIREGIDETGRLIGRLCGEGKAGTIRSASSVWLKFTSDKSVAMRGFLATYWKEGEHSSNIKNMWTELITICLIAYMDKVWGTFLE